jgi:hypothetical protein
MYDEKHRFHVLSTKQTQKNLLFQKGIREKLLCDDCEQLISKWEHYASLVLNGGAPIAFKQEGALCHLSEIEYSPFRLFQLSILWRASVSSVDFFRKVALGKHEEKLRKLLISGDSGLAWQYGCVMCALICDNALLTDLMIQPDRIKLHGCTAYRFIFGGFMWIFLVSNHISANPLQSALLSPAGTMTILKRNIESVQYIEHLTADLFEQGKV